MASVMPLEELDHEDGGCDEDEGEIIDWQLPLCFVKKRHKEAINGTKHLAQTWRMKDRVRNPMTTPLSNLHYTLSKKYVV